jgi:tetratricopeptide (TPR) repeat protein
MYDVLDKRMEKGGKCSIGSFKYVGGDINTVKEFFIMDSRILSLRDRGKNLTSNGNYDQAIAVLNEAIQIDKEYPALYSDRGQAYLKKGDYKQAIADFKTALNGMPGNDFYRQQYNDALTAQGSASSSSPASTDPDVYKSRGEEYMNNYKYELAKDEFSKALELKPDDADLYILRGKAYQSLFNLNNAIADFTEAIKLNPDNASACETRGKSYMLKRDYTLAIADFSRAIELDRTMASAYLYRGGAYRATENYDLAIADLTKAIELKYNDAYSSRGAAYTAKGDYDLAIADLTKAMELGDNSDFTKQVLKEALKKKKEQEKRDANVCKHCGGEMAGLFKKKCKVCGKEP